MSVRVGIVMDPIASISYKKDSSLAMLLAAQKRGWELFYMEQKDLYQGEGQARARMKPLKVFANPEKWFELDAEQDNALKAQYTQAWARAEAGATAAVPSAVRQDYVERMQARIAHYKRELGLAGIDYCLLDTSQPLELGLMAYLMTRRRVL